MPNHNDEFDDVPMGQKIKTGFKSMIPEQLPSSLQPGNQPGNQYGNQHGNHEGGSQGQYHNQGFQNAGHNSAAGDFVPVPPMTSHMSRPIRIALGVVAVLFVMAMIWSFTSGNRGDNGAEFANLPVLQASNEPFRVRPENPGGMEIPNADSTLYTALENDLEGGLESDNPSEKAGSGAAPELKQVASKQVESKKSAVSGFAGLSNQPAFLSLENDLKDEAVTAAAAITGTDENAQGRVTDAPQAAELSEALAAIATTPDPEPAAANQDKIENLTAALTPLQSKDDKELVEPVVNDAAVAVEPTETIIAEQEQSSLNIVKETETSPPSKTQQDNLEDNIAKAPKPEVKPDAPIKVVTPSTTQKPVSDVVESVLNGNGASPSSAGAAANPIKPIAVAGTHYVQLGSVKSTAGAAVEWGRMVKEFPQILTGQPYRTEQADLGARGIYHRIQMGPYPKNKAQALCDQLKKAGKRGGCLVVAR